MSDRDEFEAWAKADGHDIGRYELGDDQYATSLTECSWDAWQAARAPQAVPALTEPVAIICDGWDIRYVGREPIAGIVKKHGLKIGSKLYAAPQPSQEETK